MAKEGKDTTAASAGAVSADAPKGSSPLFAILNLALLLGTMGFFYYSRFMFKRPAITESGERTRLTDLFTKPAPPAVPGIVKIEEITLNISPSPDHPKTDPDTGEPVPHQKLGKLHYVTFGLAIEIRDDHQKGILEELKPLLLDQLLIILGKKQFQELTTIQGRYILHSQIIEMINHLATTRSHNPALDGLVTNVYFTQFVVQ